MTSQPESANLPAWDVADRLRKSLRHRRIGVQEMADYLDVDRSTVSAWINGRIAPPTASAKLWALRTGVPYTWLCHGSTAPCDLGPADQGRSRRRSYNMQKMPTRILRVAS